MAGIEAGLQQALIDIRWQQESGVCGVLVLCVCYLQHRLDSLCDLVVRRVGKCNVQEELVIALCAQHGGGNQTLQIHRQELNVPNDTYPYAVLVHATGLLQQFVELLARQIEDALDLLVGSLEVLDAEGECGHLSDAHVQAPAQHVGQLGEATRMTLDLINLLGPGEPTIAVHHEGDVVGNVPGELQRPERQLLYERILIIGNPRHLVSRSFRCLAISKISCDSKKKKNKAQLSIAPIAAVKCIECTRLRHNR